MINNNPKISVVVPVYNAEATLTRCLESLVNQSYSNYEIILVNNNSSDKTSEIISEFTRSYPQLFVIDEKIRGRGRARNKGVKVAQGEIIAMTDADCIAPQNWLEKISIPIIEGKAKAVIGFQKDLVNNYFTTQRHLADWDFIKTKIKGSFVNHLDTKNFAIEAKLLKRLRFDANLKAYEDWDLFIRLKKENIDIYFLPELIVGHFHDSSILELTKTQYERGKYLALILKKYKNDRFFKDTFQEFESSKSIALKNFILFLPWAIMQLFLHTKKAPFRIIADLSWKMGVIGAKFEKDN